MPGGMDGNGADKGPDRSTLEAARIPEAAEDAHRPGGRPGPGWRAWLLSIVAAIVLSVAATLIFGGSFRLSGASNGAAGDNAAGSASPCCPLQGDGKR